MIDERTRQLKPECSFSMENRARLSVTGVIDVVSFDNEVVILDTKMGILVVKGIDFKINKLNVDIGELVIMGQIDSCSFDDMHDRKKEGFFAKLFK